MVCVLFCRTSVSPGPVPARQERRSTDTGAKFRRRVFPSATLLDSCSAADMF